MPFPFVYVCDLLDALEQPHLRRAPLLPRDFAAYTRETIITWFKRHRDSLNAFSTDGPAVMSMLQPEKQTDRVYGLDSETLELVIARTLSLERAKYVELQRWHREPFNGDLGTCLSRVMQNMQVKIAVRAVTNSVTVEEIHQALLHIAAFKIGSSEAVRSLAKGWELPDELELLGNIYQRLQAREAKWFTRVILKSYAPVQFPEDLLLGSQHSYLPNCVTVHVRFAGSGSAPIRREGSMLVRGIGSTVTPAEALSTPPKSSPLQIPSPRTTSASSARTDSIKLPVSPVPIVQLSRSRVITPSLPGSELRDQSSRRNSLYDSFHPPTPAQHSFPGRTPNSSIKSYPPLSPPKSIDYSPSSSMAALGTSSSNIPGSSSSGRQLQSADLLCKPLVTAGTGNCRLTDKICPISTCVFLLCPYISDVPWITENLLVWHGSRYIKSLSALSHPVLRGSSPRPGRSFRKVALVESRHLEQTVAFLKEIRKLGLKRKGEKEWVEVYDWRLLECIAKADRGKELGYNPWKRCFIGAV